jgi:hypothetical protein
VKSEVKFIVFINKLLLLFHICPFCKADGLLVDWKLIGTMLELTSSCANICCTGKTFKWKSQPEMRGTMMPAGNFLLSFATLVSGSSATLCTIFYIYFLLIFLEYAFSIHIYTLGVLPKEDIRGAE